MRSRFTKLKVEDRIPCLERSQAEDTDRIKELRPVLARPAFPTIPGSYSFQVEQNSVFCPITVSESSLPPNIFKNMVTAHLQVLKLCLI